MDAVKTVKPHANKFERVEKKFRMSEEQYNALLPILEEHCARDGYGTTIICSVYYDTPDYMLIRKSIERPKFKEKLRVRSYGVPKDDTKVFVEIKRKLNGVVYKRRISIPCGEVKTLMSGTAVGSDNPQIENEILEFVRRYGPEPRVYLSYERFAMYGRDDPSLRVTFDKNLRYRTDDTDIMSGAEGAPVMDDSGSMLMEIKAPSAIPMWLTDEMSRLRIYQAPFSKVGTCFLRHIAPVLTGINQ